MRLSLEMSMSAVAKELGEVDQTLWRIFRHHVSNAIKEQIVLNTVKRISVDETACKRGHNYITIFTDLDTGNVILVEEGRTKEVFNKLYNWLLDKGGNPKCIQLFSMDMSKSYQSGRREYFYHSEVVFDRFHIKKAVNEALDKVRKQEVITCEALKKTKYIWLKNEQSLTIEQRKKLVDFLNDGSSKTAQGYQLKTSFDLLWRVQSKAIESTLEIWLKQALESTLKPFENLVAMIKRNYAGIVNSMKTGITNACAEGLNSIVQMAKSRARGFRNIENFKAMVYCLGNDFKFEFH
jgi:transposase